MKLIPSFLLFTFLLLTSCSSKNCDCPIDSEILKENNEAFEEIEKLGSWSELGLQDYKDFNNDTYRLTIYPTWTNSEISEYKMENGWGKPKIFVNRYERMDGTGITKLKKIGETKEFILSEIDWTEFESLIKEKCFWAMPVLTKELYLDGTGWILDAKKSGESDCSNRNYHIVSRVANSPKFFELCDKLLTLANSSKKEQDSLLRKSWTSD